MNTKKKKQTSPVVFDTIVYELTIKIQIYGPPKGGSVKSSITDLHSELRSPAVVFASNSLRSFNKQNWEQPGIVSGVASDFVEFFKKIETPNSPVFLCCENSKRAAMA